MIDERDQDADSVIAVIGMAGRFPGAAGIDEFWTNLRAGTESIARLPDQPGGDPGYVASFGVLDGADEFDAGFFGYAPAEALVVDPQQRLFLECAYEALERAGYGAAAGRGSVGVFAGGSTTDYRAALESQLHRLPFVDGWQVRLGTAPDFLATRVAHKLGLRGPAVSVQTACSTSLVAVHLAIQALLAGDCRIALAGGASVHAPYPRINYTEGGIIARDGHCRAFDADATGTVGGNAVAIVVLKPLIEALADGDHVHAVLLGSAVNNDGGNDVGFTAPNIDGQAEVIRAAQVVAGVDPDTITYVEAHGTGTRLGDPIEVAALTKAFRGTTGTRRQQCAIGSVKTNIGHTDAAAGVTGLIKTVLAVEHGLIPPSLHFARANPEIDFAGSPFVVNSTLREWRPPGIPRRAGVSSLGVGGTNAHVVVQQPPPPPASDPPRRQQLLVLSAKTPAALDDAGLRLAEHLRECPGANLADVAWTLQAGRQAHRFRRFVVGADPHACATMLAGTATAGPNTGHGDAAAAPAPAVTFMFPGQGGQHVGMARELYEDEPVFGEVFDECARIARPALGVDLRSVLFPPPGDEHAVAEQLGTIAVGQPAVFAVEYALARLLLSWGVRPAAVVGHSLGAFAAACVAGVFSLPDAVPLVVRRGRLLQSLPAGAMVAVRLAAAETALLLPDGLSVAAVNGPDQCTVSGPVDRAEAFAAELTARDIEARVLPIPTAGHSALVEPVVDEFRAAVDALDPQPATIPFVSDTTGTWVSPEQPTTGEYWATHLRAPVQFDTALSTLFAGPRRALVEVGPGGTLVTLARRHPDLGHPDLGHPELGQHLAVQTLPHPLDEASDLAATLGAIGTLWVTGAPIDWEAVRGGQRRRRVVLPTYPFERKRYLVQAPEPATGNGSAAGPSRELDTSGVRMAGNPGGVEFMDAGTGPAAADRPPGTEPVSELESTLAAAFAQALGLDRVACDDDLFRLGADSLTATKLAAWGSRRFGVTLKAADIIRARTVTAVAGVVQGRLGTPAGEAGPPAGGGSHSPPAGGGSAGPPADGGSHSPPADGGSDSAAAVTASDGSAPPVGRRPNSSGSGWLSCRRRVATPAVRLYCLPHSGGAAGEYLRLGDAMPEVEVWGLNLPGRGPRLDEPPLGSMVELAGAVVDGVEFATPFVLFGHSFGALLAYHVAQELRARRREQPDHLLLSGYPPPHLPRVAPAVSDLPDDEFLARLGEFYGGVPAELRRDPELAALVLPAYRADVAILERYADPGHEPLDRPLVVVGGDRDVFSEEQLAQWSRHTTAECRVHLLPGGHFYFRERPELLIGLVRGCPLTR